MLAVGFLLGTHPLSIRITLTNLIEMLAFKANSSLVIPVFIIYA